jgi:type II restriction/modification system DNA methylase subunit YeeA
MLSSENASGRVNSDVVVPVLNAADIMRISRNYWTIDFRQMPLDEASLYERPFNYVSHKVHSERVNSKTKSQKWWLYERPRVDLREALKNLCRYIATPRVAKHRVFVWVSTKVLANDANVAIARDDDYMFGLLQSKLHELWARRLGTQLREADSGSRYTSTTTFETFPFPWPPGQEDQADPRVQAIAEAARELVRLRDEWLNPPGLFEAELKQRTLTNLYNRRPDWLTEAHKRLDAAVFDAYGWPHDLSDDEILARLLALNLERAAVQGEVLVGEEDNDQE